MPAEDTCVVLNELMALLSRSLPMYLADAAPWTRQGDAEAIEELEAIVADQRQLIERLGEMILDRDGTVLPSHFPMEFTSIHDVSLEYLLSQLAAYQRTQVHRVEHGVTRLEDDVLAQRLAKEVLGSSRAHLVTLEELAEKFSSPSSAA